MKRRDIVMGLIVIIVFVGGLILINRNKKNTSNLPSPTPSISEQVTKKFGNITIPANADQTDLTDVSGGNGMGTAARTFENGKYTITILADLPTPKAGTFYQGWIVKGDTYLSIGKLTIAKGGYMVNYSVSKDYRDYTKIVVTTEKVFDNKPETHILEGSY